MFNLDFLRQSSLIDTTLYAAPSKSYVFSTNYHAWIALPTWRRCAPPILCWPWPPYNIQPAPDFLMWFSLMGTTLRAAPSKSYAFSTNYHACIVMPTWHRCAPILFWPWPPYITCSWGRVLLGCSSSILTDGYYFACSAKQKLCLFNKLSYMHCNANMT